MVYSEKIRCKVIRFYGENSEIYQALMNGKIISKMVKASCGKTSQKKVTMRDRLSLYMLCLDEEKNNVQNKDSVVVL